MCRVGSPHRTTVDLDAVARGPDRPARSIARLAVTASGGGGSTGFGGGARPRRHRGRSPAHATSCWSILVADGEPLTDLELNVVAHTWAHDGATPLDVVAVDEVTGERLAEAPGRHGRHHAGIVAMKVTTVPLRASSKPEKRASDLYDLRACCSLPGTSSAGDIAAMPERSRLVRERLARLVRR